MFSTILKSNQDYNGLAGYLASKDREQGYPMLDQINGRVLVANRPNVKARTEYNKIASPLDVQFAHLPNELLFHAVKRLSLGDFTVAATDDTNFIRRWDQQTAWGQCWPLASLPTTL